MTGLNAKATGWGSVSYEGPNSPLLKQVTLSIAYKPTCKEVYPVGAITRLNICAGLVESGKDVCNGDDGGPLAIKLGQNWTQVGIVSTVSCGTPGQYSVFTRVSVFYNWIIQQLSSN